MATASGLILEGEGPLPLLVLKFTGGSPWFPINFFFMS